MIPLVSPEKKRTFAVLHIKSLILINR